MLRWAWLRATRPSRVERITVTLTVRSGCAWPSAVATSAAERGSFCSSRWRRTRSTSFGASPWADFAAFVRALRGAFTADAFPAGLGVAGLRVDLAPVGFAEPAGFDAPPAFAVLPDLAAPADLAAPEVFAEPPAFAAPDFVVAAFLPAPAADTFFRSASACPPRT